MATKDTGGQRQTTRRERGDRGGAALQGRTTSDESQRAPGEAGRRRRRDPGRDRRGAGGERRGVRPGLRAEGRAVTARAALRAGLTRWLYCPACAGHGGGRAVGSGQGTNAYRPEGCPWGSTTSAAGSQLRAWPPAARPSPTSSPPPPRTCCPVRRRPAWRGPEAGPLPHGMLPHGTTIVAPTFDGGVVMAGDRRATVGNIIAQRDIEKVFRSRRVLLRRHRRHGRDRARAGPAVPGRARALREDRGPVALAGGQGQPAGHHDPRQPRRRDAGPGRGPAVRRVRPGRAGRGRIFSYDVAGGRYEEHDFHAIGSGSVFARGSLKKLYRDGHAAPTTRSPPACRRCTTRPTTTPRPAAPTSTRRIFPVVATVTADGFRRLSDEEAGGYAQAVVDERMRSPGAHGRRCTPIASNG